MDEIPATGDVSELAAIVHACLSDIYDALESLEVELPDDMQTMLDRIETLSDLLAP